MKKVAIIGAGPAGVYCALHLKKIKDIEIDIFEKNIALKTLLATGGGRCNLTHWADDIREFAANYPRGEKFLYSIFSKHFIYDTLHFFESIGIKTYMQEDMRYFPISNSAKDMREKMLHALKGVKIINKEIKSLKELNEYNLIVIATGSKGGYNLAKEIGHNIIEPKPSLCGLKLSKDSPKYPRGVILKTPQGEVLFTDEGISGPLIYKISSINARKNFPYKITLPLIDIQDLTEEIKNNPKKSFGNIVSNFIPKSLAHAIIENYDKKCAQITKKEIESLKTISFKVISTDKKGEIVTCGGINLKELNKYCQSKIMKNVFFCGEVMDIDGFCGGYNLQNCWSSAYCVYEGIKTYLSLQKEQQLA